MAAIVAEDAQALADERRRQSPHAYKYTEYQSNRNLLVSAIKNRLIEAVLDPHADRRDKALKRLNDHIQRALIPVRRGRTAPRYKGQI